MSKKNLQSKESSLEVISLSIRNLNECMKLDEIALKGLWSKQQWEKELASSRRLCFGVLDLSNLIALGTGWIVLDELHLTAIAVHPLHRRRGLAQKVLSKLFNQATNIGCTRVTLEVKSNNKEALGLYMKCGFSTAGLRPNYYKNGDDALIQWKSLSLNKQKEESAG